MPGRITRVVLPAARGTRVPCLSPVAGSPRAPRLFTLPSLPLTNKLLKNTHTPALQCPQLTALGILMGFSYVRTRNLLTPILIHGAWNGGVLSILYAIAAGGGDVQELLRSGL